MEKQRMMWKIEQTRNRYVAADATFTKPTLPHFAAASPLLF